jgi:hypothetical protein
MAGKNNKFPFLVAAFFASGGEMGEFENGLLVVNKALLNHSNLTLYSLFVMNFIGFTSYCQSKIVSFAIYWYLSMLC